MKKLMLTALLFPGMHLTICAGPASPPADTIPPIITSIVPARPYITIRIANNDRSQNLSNTVLEWELLANGISRQRGTVSQLLIAPQHTGLFRLPVRIMSGKGEEMFLQLRYLRRIRLSLQSKVITQQRLLLQPWGNHPLTIPPTGELSFSDEDGIFTIRSPAIRIRFDKQTGWLLQYEVKGTRLLEDTFPIPPAQESPWHQTGHPPRLQLFSTSTGSEIVIVRTEYSIPETFFQLHLAYTINATGEMLVERSIEADSTQKGPPLPQFSLQWVLPPGLDSVTGYGPIPANDSIPVNDSLAVIYRKTIRETTALSSTAIRYWTITGKDGKGLLITADSSLLNMRVFSTAGPSTQLNIDYPSAYPLPLPYGSYHYSFKISPVIP